MGWTGPFVPVLSGETSADKCVDLPPIYPPHLHFRVRSVLDFALICKLVRPEYALYAVSVRRAGSLLRTSFRFHLAMDTLVFRLQFLLTSLYRTFTDESTHMPRIQNENADLSCKEKSAFASRCPGKISIRSSIRHNRPGCRADCSLPPVRHGWLSRYVKND